MWGLPRTSPSAYSSTIPESRRRRAPWELVHTESFLTRAQATKREKKIRARGIQRYLATLATNPAR